MDADHVSHGGGDGECVSCITPKWRVGSEAGYLVSCVVSDGTSGPSTGGVGYIEGLRGYRGGIHCLGKLHALNAVGRVAVDLLPGGTDRGCGGGTYRATSRGRPRLVGMRCA